MGAVKRERIRFLLIDRRKDRQCIQTLQRELKSTGGRPSVIADRIANNEPVFLFQVTHARKILESFGFRKGIDFSIQTVYLDSIDPEGGI